MNQSIVVEVVLTVEVNADAWAETYDNEAINDHAHIGHVLASSLESLTSEGLIEGESITVQTRVVAP